MRKVTVFVLVCALILVLCANTAFAKGQQPVPVLKANTGAQAAAKIETGRYKGKQCVRGEIIVKYKSGTTNSETFALNKYSTQTKTASEGKNKIVQLENDDAMDKAIAELKNDPNVQYAQPNYIYKITDTVTDPGIGKQWYLGNYPGIDLNPSGWVVTQGSSSIKVATVDTGIDFNHEDLQNKVVAATNCYDHNDTGADATDENGHGTHVAGIIAANANNGMGIAGVAPNVKLVVANVCDAQGTSDSQSIASGIDYAISNGVKVINISIGGLMDTEDDVLKAALQRAANAGIVVVCAAGNNGTSESFYPSDDATVVSVVATDENGRKASFSNYGSAKDISAPGTNIYSTYYNPRTGESTYEYLSGTSMAAPVVTGVFALMYSKYPALTAAKAKNAVYNSARDLGTAGFDSTYGYGLVDAAKALSYAGAYAADMTAPTLAMTSASTLKFSNKGTSSATFGIKVSEKSAVNAYIVNSSGTIVKQYGSQLILAGSVYNYTWNGRNNSGIYVKSGTYYFKACATDMATNKSTVVSRKITLTDYTKPAVSVSSKIYFSKSAKKAISTTINLSEPAYVYAKLYDKNGSFIRNLADKKYYTAGKHTISFTGKKTNNSFIKFSKYRLKLKIYAKDANGNTSSNKYTYIYLK